MKTAKQSMDLEYKGTKKRLNLRTALISLCMFAFVGTSAQTGTVTVKLRNASVKELFSVIEKQTSYRFSYRDAEIKGKGNVTISATNRELKQLLEGELSKLGLKYAVSGNKIIVTPVAAAASAQPKKVTGKVVDANGEPVIGATIKEQGTANGTITDFDGNFTLDVADNAMLEVSYIGYKSQELQAVAGKTLSVTLREDTEVLDEVVVVGYGTMKKKDLTGAVSSVKMSDEPLSTVSTVSHVLAGKAAGLQVSTISAQPGGGSSFRIRGAASSEEVGNDPLIIIDGFSVSDPGSLNVGRYEDGTKDNILASINPNDIESIEVLKDASSTAIYGARAGNGVIIVTTKKGKEGRPTVKYSGSAAVQTIAKNYEVLNARDFMIQSNRYYKEKWMKDNNIGIYGGVDESSVDPYVPKYSDVDNPVNDTDWIDGVTRNGFQTQHNVSISGGTENTKYLVTGNFFQQNGILENNGMKRYTGRINLEHKISKYVKTGVNLTLSTSNYDNVPLGAGQSENASLLVSASQYSPLLPIKDGNGDYSLNPEAAYVPNPMSMLEISDKTNRKRILGTAFLEITPIKNLVLKANLGVDNNMMKRKVYLPTSTLYGKKEGGKADIGSYDKNDYLLDLTANYSVQIKEHSLTALVGYSFQSFNEEGFNAGNSQFLTDGFLYNNLGAGSYPKPSVGSSASKNEMASFFGRISYSYKDRYLLTATLRVDGASNFAENNRWGYFPSVSLGWRFSEEPFMKGLENVSNAKLRLSYGQTGNSNIGNRAISFYKTGNDNIFGGTIHKGVYLERLGNPDLSWETTSEINVGLDWGLWNNRVNITGEYYYKVVSDLLDWRNLLSHQEVEKVAANIGKTQSTGFELTVNTRNFETPDFSWTTDLTFSLYRDKWKDRGAYWKPAAYDIYDAPLRGSYGYVSDGLIQVGETVDHMPGSLPGQVKLKDLDGFIQNPDGSLKVDENGVPLKSGKPDGKLDDADKVFYGNEDPGYLFGLNNTFRWKNFDLNIYFYGQFDKLMYGSYKTKWLAGDGYMSTARMGTNYNMPVTVANVWSHDNQNTSYPSFFQNESSWGYGDYLNEKSWFIRCRNITLGYNLPKSVLKNLLSSLRVYVDVNNPFVITPYEGLDPETDNSTYAYPNVRSFSFGIDVTF